MDRTLTCSPGGGEGMRGLTLLYEVLNAAYDLDQDYLSTAALQTLCVEAVLPEVAPAEVPWHAHQLRRRLTDEYRALGAVLHAGEYSIPGLLDSLMELAQDRAVS
jgi:hypothetical protein